MNADGCSCPRQQRAYIKTLDMIKIGDCVEVCTIKGRGETTEQLTGMGFVSGVYVHVANVTSDGIVEVEVLGQRITLERHQTELIRVMPIKYDDDD